MCWFWAYCRPSAEQTQSEGPRILYGCNAFAIRGNPVVGTLDLSRGCSKIWLHHLPIKPSVESKRTGSAMCLSSRA